MRESEARHRERQGVERERRYSTVHAKVILSTFKKNTVN